ncbi:hypothetical protein ONE63_005289 [Megalurothrips usitatus]|uniref:UBC core domain-containing protein n=1 Tax=Megalurothrips usitatus TaxID=439358 RepID=A0AAV7XVY2_9NEOP|nr:hypothetical protein ONE63_005289 [Megalurothrips usitatus]
MQNGCALATGSARSLLVQEFKEWKEQNKVSLSLVNDSVCDDGRVCLKLSLGRDKVFSLFCPAEYPEYEDNFFAESESVNHLWLNALNEFILDSAEGLTLEAILWKANSLDSRVRYSPSNSSDEEDENEEFMVLEEEDEEDLMERALWDKEKQWRAKEAELRASMKEAEEAAGPSTSSGMPIKDQKTMQVFSNFAASGILTNDLKHIIKTASETGIDVEPIDSNIYEWSVRFSKFDPDTKLQRDLDMLKEAHGIGYIELQLEFTMDLYPFYPPVAKMVRPRPEGSVRFMLACLDILKLSSWNPTCGMITVLEEIKDYLAKHAVLPVETAFRPSILLPIENSLLQLALVSEVMPRDTTTMDSSLNKLKSDGSCSRAASFKLNLSTISTSSGSSSSLAVAGPSGTSSTQAASGTSGTMSSSASTSSTSSLASEASKTSISKKPRFPDGTGYSTFSDKGWDINAHIAVEKEKDKKIEAVLQKILLDLQEYLRHYDNMMKPSDDPMVESTDSADMSDESMMCNGILNEPSTSKSVLLLFGLEALGTVHPTDKEGTSAPSEEKKVHLPSQSDATRQLYEALEASTLIPFIEQKLQVDSFLEICRHKAVYRCVIDILSEIAGRLWLARLLWKQPGQKKSIYSLLLSIKDKAQKVLDRYKMAAESSHSKNEKKGKKRANSGSRDKDKTTRRSKVASARNVGPLEMEDSDEDEAGPSGAIGINGSVDFCELHNLHGDYVYDSDNSSTDVFDNIDAMMLPPDDFAHKKGVVTRKDGKANKSDKASTSALKASTSSGKSSMSSASTSKASPSTSKASASASKSSAGLSKALANTSKAPGPSSVPKVIASTSKASTSSSKATPSTSKASTSSSKASASTSKGANADGSSASGSSCTSFAHAGSFCKLKFFSKLDAKKNLNGEHSNKGNVPSVLSSKLSDSFLSNLTSLSGISWPSWSGITNEQDPPPIDMATPLDPAGDEQLAQDFFDLALKVEKVIDQLGFPGCDSPEHSDEPLEARRVSVITSTSEVLNQELSTKYIAALKDMQFDSCDIDVTNPTSHIYATTFNSALAPGRPQMMRIAQELASISTSLPLDLASAIFVRSDDSKITLLKALIIGPEGTPYASGCFLFDIFLPSNYPKSPPKVTLRTTGRGTVRFNPNLYANGKVCLSLLGTWNGLQGEQWNETSTLLQVLVSIQSLIMVAEPYFNEPGYDSLMGTPDGKYASETYNHNVKNQTVRLAMIEMLKFPPADFEDVVKTHFRIKRKRIMQDIEDYLLLHPTQFALAKSYKSLKSELMRLKD